MDETSIGGSNGVRSGNSVGKGSTVGKDLGFSISITLAIVSVSVWVSVASVSIGIRSGISVVSIESISISLWFSISITLAIVSVSVDSGMVGEGDSLGHSVKSLGDGVKTGAGAEGDTSNQELGISLSVSLAIVSSSARDGDIGGVDTGGGLE